MKKIMFSVHSYNTDGGLEEEGIYLHLGDIRIKVADSLEEYERVVEKLGLIYSEIQANYCNVKGELL